MSEREVVAEITVKELNEKKDINAELYEIDHQIENLVEKASEIRKRDHEWWRKIRRNYDLEPSHLFVDTIEGEIVRSEKEEE